MLLKAVLLDAASSEMARGEAKPTQPALRMLSGVYRMVVRALMRAPATVRM